MGGSHHNKATSNGSRSSGGKPYGLMLLLAFGLALFGVMVLHKLREKRIFSLIIKEKDSQLISLQFLLQKEREYNEEMKTKNEEMRTKMYSLRTQKMELDRRLLEMQSTIDSLQDEQKALEFALEEKQNEIKMQKGEIVSSIGYSQLIALKEILKKREAEIEDLRHRLEYPVKIWSVSNHDPWNPPVNLTDSLTDAEKHKTNTSTSKENGGELPGASTNFVGGENSKRVEDRSEKGRGDTNSKEMTVEHLQKLENSQVEGFKNGGVIEGKVINEGKGELKNAANSTEPVVDVGGNVWKLRDNSNDIKDGTEHAITSEKKSEKVRNSQEDENQGVEAISEGGMKSDMPDSRKDVGAGLRGTHGRLSRRKGKRWRTLAKNRPSDNNELANMRIQRLYRHNEDESRSRRESEASNQGLVKSEGKETGENPLKVKQKVESADAKLLTAKPEDAVYMKNRDENADPNQQLQQEDEMSKKSHSFPDREMHMNTSVNDEATNISSYAEKGEFNEDRHPDEEIKTRAIQQKSTSGDNMEELNRARQVKKDDRRNIGDERGPADRQISENEATNSGSFGESTSNVEEYKEEYKEEIDESEI